MHVVHHFTTLTRAGGGVPRAVVDLACGLARAGVSTTLLTSEGSEVPADEVASAGLHVGWLEPARRPFEWLSGGGRARAREHLRQAAVLHLHGLWRPRNAQLARLARSLGVPYVVSPHGMLNAWAMAQGSRWKRLYLALVERRTLAGAARLHFAAGRERDQARPWIGGRATAVIPLAVDLGPYLSGSAAADPGDADPGGDDPGGDVPLVLMIGRLHPGKRAEVALDAVAALAARGVPCELRIAGTGPPDYVATLAQRARAAGIAERVHFLGLVLGQAKLDLYRRAAVCVLPTVGENFGLVLFESLASGTPVVTTRGADTWEEIRASGGGLVADGTADAFADALGGLLADPAGGRAMGRRGRDWVAHHLDRQRVIGAYRDLYRSVLNDG